MFPDVEAKQGNLSIHEGESVGGAEYLSLPLLLSVSQPTAAETVRRRIGKFLFERREPAEFRIERARQRAYGVAAFRA